jgi:hypothetical protein
MAMSPTSPSSAFGFDFSDHPAGTGNAATSAAAPADTACPVSRVIVSSSIEAIALAESLALEPLPFGGAKSGNQHSLFGQACSRDVRRRFFDAVHAPPHRRTPEQIEFLVALVESRVAYFADVPREGAQQLQRSSCNCCISHFDRRFRLDSLFSIILKMFTFLFFFS